MHAFCAPCFCLVCRFVTLNFKCNYDQIQKNCEKEMCVVLTNPVLLSVVFMSVLCVFKVNILLAIMLSALLAGIMAGVSSGATFVLAIETTMKNLIEGMGGNSETALSYVLLGALAYAIHQSGLAAKLSRAIEKILGKNATILVLVIAVIASLSQNLIPVHIAFIPILIPPMLGLFNELKIDRRAIACALTFGLKAPYIVIPAGFGLIFHGIISREMTANNMAIPVSEVWKALVIPAIGMVFGLFTAVFVSYRKNREYKQTEYDIEEIGASGVGPLNMAHYGAMLGAFAAFGIQVLTKSLPLGALIGLLIMLAFNTIEFKKLDNTINNGIFMMGFIAFVMLVAAGYGNVIRQTGGVAQLVEGSAKILGNSKMIAAIVMLMLGLIITMGIGTSFGTIPIIAAIYVPLCAQLGFSAAATACLIGVAGALGDAGSPASDSTLGPTAGLNVDGQHDHIWDTCVPTFLHYNIPLVVFGLIASLYL